MASKVWFITGTSKGFGRVWAEAALARGDRVAATARDVKTLQPLVDRYGEQVAALALDVNDKAAVASTVSEAHRRFGRIDIAINNAGFGLFGAIEEISEADARAQIETNLFGALWVTQAVLPIMRAQGSGHIVQVSSIGGVNAFPDRRAVPRFQMGARGVQPVARRGGRGIRNQGDAGRAGGGYATDWSGPSARHAEPLTTAPGPRSQPCAPATPPAIRTRPRLRFSRSWMRKTRRWGRSSAPPGSP